MEVPGQLHHTAEADPDRHQREERVAVGAGIEPQFLSERLCYPHNRCMLKHFK